MPPRRHTAGPLVIIGGHEDKEQDRVILRTVVRELADGPLIVLTAASEVPDALWSEYQRVFRRLGVRQIRHLHVDSRAEALEGRAAELLRGAGGVFVTGGDQLRITSQIGDTPVYDGVRAVYEQGGVIAGTSAGASVMCETMMVSGDGEVSPRIASDVRLAPGFGFFRDAIVDQHFAERGRIGRLLGAVALNPRVLGVGIDENTAVVVRRSRAQVVGAGAVYMVDASGVDYSNVVDEPGDRALSIFGLRLHVLTQGDTFDLVARAPAHHAAELIDEALDAGP